VAGEIARSAATGRSEDDGFGQLGMLVREVLDDDARVRLVSTITGHPHNGVHGEVLDRALEYWRRSMPVWALRWPRR